MIISNSIKTNFNKISIIINGLKIIKIIMITSKFKNKLIIMFKINIKEI